MAHISIKMDTPCEFINIVPMNPLISKCQIKVCYVGEEPNRNRSIITKEVATQMANSLPGSPIVGFYNEETGDFEEHNREIEVKDGKLILKDVTRPYGFVDLNAKCWFQKFLDDGVEHEYLMTEGYLWTGQYPEAKRVIDKGNNHSMELDEDLTKASWTNLDNSKGKFFIVNESVFSKLCILGEDYEPCFEGSTISKMQFSFDEDFNQKMYSMMNMIAEYINKGGEAMPNTDEILEAEVQTEETPVPVEESAESSPAAEDNVEEIEASGSDPEEETPEVEAEEEPDAPAAEDTTEEEENDPVDNIVQYDLNEIPEYMELSNNYAALQAERDTLNETIDNLNNELAELKNFKLTVERKDKMAMINSFYMLSDAEKADVKENIDKYTLDEIEAKLAVICVRNKVNFNLDTEEVEEEASFTFNLDETNNEDANVPAWVKAVLETSKNKI